MTADYSTGSGRSGPDAREVYHAAGVARIAILVKNLGVGGSQRGALMVARGLRERGHAVDLLLRKPYCDWPDDVPAGLRLLCVSQSREDEALDAIRRQLGRSDVAFATIPTVPPWKLRHANRLLFAAWQRWGWQRFRRRPLFSQDYHARLAFRVAAYLDRERPDALLACGFGPPIWAAGARRLARRRVRTVAMLNGWLDDDMARMMRCVSHSVDAVVAVSRACARFASEVVKVPVPVHTIYQPLVGPDALRSAAEPVDHPWIGGDVPVILAAASLGKDYPTLLRALALLAARRPARLIILGTGPEARLRELKALARSLGIADVVDFAGFVVNPIPFMAKVDLFVLSSRGKEGLPQVLVQAMTVGCKMVATDCPVGPSEVLGGGDYGRLAPVGDPAGLAEALERELETPRDTDKLRARAAELFGVDRAVDAHERLLLTG